MLAVRLSEELDDKIEKYIKAKKLTKSQLVKQAVSAFLREEELKAYHDERTMQGLKEIDRGKGIPGDVVFDLLSKWSSNG